MKDKRTPPSVGLRYTGWKAYQIILGFYGAYVVLVLAGRILIRYPGISVTTLLTALLYLSSICIGAYVGGKLKPARIMTVRARSLDRVMKYLGLATLLPVAYTGWSFLRYYGSLEYILSFANAVRYQQIGQETGIVPFYTGYASSLIYGLFALCLARIGSEGGKWYKAAALYFFFLIFLSDVWTFGRIGTLYAIFCITGFFTVFRIKRLITAKNILLLAVMFLVLSTPRLIRTAEGDFGINVGGWLADYSEPYLKYPVPRITKQALDAYINYISGIYALDDYIYANPGGEHTLGFRTLTPVFRVYNRLVGIGYVSTIDRGAGNPMVGLYGFNVYTFIRDLYGDFGILGVAIVPCLIGLFFGALFNCRGVGYDALKIYSMGWLLYTPIYNAFSFGGFLISFVFLLALNRAFRNRAPASPATRPAVPQSPAVALSLPAGGRSNG
jgi:hypothetical protein